MLPMGCLFLLKSFLFLRVVQKGVKEFVLVIAIVLQRREEEVHGENPYFQIMIEKVWSSVVGFELRSRFLQNHPERLLIPETVC